MGKQQGGGSGSGEGHHCPSKSMRKRVGPPQILDPSSPRFQILDSRSQFPDLEPYSSSCSRIQHNTTHHNTLHHIQITHTQCTADYCMQWCVMQLYAVQLFFLFTVKYVLLYRDKKSSGISMHAELRSISEDCNVTSQNIFSLLTHTIGKLKPITFLNVT